MDSASCTGYPTANTITQYGYLVWYLLQREWGSGNASERVGSEQQRKKENGIEVWGEESWNEKAEQWKRCRHE